ncbi:unnamed protein product [Taenia asiatica]|uniref:FZ domain-containing protein n=1 Tax=Taenia asiatica TaxID=60517 RepID=A0A0R3W878_TAEAS|nr:unnamed protein product [Taenia asiatica]
MAKHHPDLIFCRKQPGVLRDLRLLCSTMYTCSHLKMCHLRRYWRIRCLLLSRMYNNGERCKSSIRDGCPKIVNLGSAKTDLFYERKKYGFKKRSY